MSYRPVWRTVMGITASWPGERRRLLPNSGGRRTLYMPSTSLEDLTPQFRKVAMDFLEQCNGIEPCVVICTLRSDKEQQAALAAGNSWVNRSKHQGQPPDGLSHAIDICPKRLLAVKNWGPTDPVWWRIGKIGKDLGLRWGGDWKEIGLPPYDPEWWHGTGSLVSHLPSGVQLAAMAKLRSSWDPGHVELKHVTPIPVPTVAPPIS